MPADYRNYQPLVLDEISIDVLKSDRYRRFIRANTIEPGVRLLLRRSGLRPNWPYVDTKFNPNTGADLPDSSYKVLYSWFLGRGTEALAAHVPIIDELTDLTPLEKEQAKRLFARLVDSQARAILKIIANNQGRCFFRNNLDFRAVDADGKVVATDPTRCGDGDFFCGKGLVAAGSPASVASGMKMLLEFGEFVRRGRVIHEQSVPAVTSDVTGQGERMQMMGAALLVRAKTADVTHRKAVLDVCAEFMRFVLDRHFDSAAGRYSEYFETATGKRLSYLDPGHANELVGLGLGAVEAMEAETGWLNAERRELVAGAKAELPRILIACTRIGWNNVHHGLHKAVDNVTGHPINDDMPWWNLPETMRAAVRAYEVAGDEQTRRACLECFRLTHNAYFEHYLNRNNMLFAFQTRSGATGQVLNKAPAVPEGDPLYHTHLSLLDMLTVIERIH